PETAAPMPPEIGTENTNAAIILLLYALGNQYVIYRITPGKKPASAAPSKKRTVYKAHALFTKAAIIANAPQVIIMRAIHFRAPYFSSSKLLGISNRK